MANIDYTDEIQKHLWRLNMPEAELYLAEFFISQNLVFQENLLKSLLVDAYRQVSLRLMRCYLTYTTKDF